MATRTAGLLLGGMFSLASAQNTVPCTGPVQHNLQFGTAGDYAMADNICCHNSYYAEPFGYHASLAQGAFFDQLDPTVVTTFYDSVCGVPLFRAPVGRTFAAWRTESEHHGWPSFRPEETFSENIIIHPGGEMSSSCGTHLGHNLPDRTGARYCIDLVCMAGGDSSAAAVARPPPPPPVAPLASSGAIKTYWGAGCYWHTQYDMYLVETDPAGPFARTDVDITAHVGYAGGYSAGPTGLVCYHNNARPQSLYSDYNHGEATEVVLDGGSSAVAQFNALLEKFFEEFRQSNGAWSRLDPQDWGAAYRCLIGIPGGVDGALYPLLVAANNDYTDGGVILRAGRGRGDTIDEGTIYVYDTADFPFYRGEQYHQFHANTVLRRAVPASYTGALKAAQIRAHKIDPTGCPDPGAIGDVSPAMTPPPPPAPAAAGASIGGQYTGSMDVSGALPWDPAVHMDLTVEIQATCVVGQACGTVRYAGGLACTSTLTLVSQDLVIYNMAETITSGSCVAEPSITIGRASGGLGFRTSKGSVLLRAGGDLMVSGDDCASAIVTFAGRLNTECCTGGVRCDDGVPAVCSPTCAAMWTPFATRCGDYIRSHMPQLTAFSTTCVGSGH